MNKRLDDVLGFYFRTAYEISSVYWVNSVSEKPGTMVVL